MTEEMFARLRAPFPPNKVSWRVGSTTGDKKRGMALAYIDARDVMERLDDVCGPAGWQCRYPHANGKTVCEIGINIRSGIVMVAHDGNTVFPESWVWKADGAGDTDFEAEKGALSDAFKRAAVRWGIGRYLYDVSAPWVAIEQHGKSYSIAPSEMPKLARLLSGDKPPATLSVVPAETDNSALDEQAIAHDLMKRISATKTAKELEALVRDPGFIAAFRSLSDPVLETVSKAGNARREILSNLTMAG